MTRILFAVSLFLAATLPDLAGADELTAIIQKDLTTLGYETGSTDGEMTVKTAVAVSKFQAENGLDVTGEITPQLAGVIKAAISKQGRAASASPAPAAMQAAQVPAAPGMNPTALAAMMQRGGGMDPAAMQAMTQAGMDPAAMQAMMAAMQDGAPAMDPAMMQAMQAQAGTQPQPVTAASAQQACLQQKVADAQKAQEAAQKKRGFGSLMRAVSRIGGDDLAQKVAEVQGDLYDINATASDLESAARDLGLTEADVEDCRNAR